MGPTRKSCKEVSKPTLARAGSVAVLHLTQPQSFGLSFQWLQSEALKGFKDPADEGGPQVRTIMTQPCQGGSWMKA